MREQDEQWEMEGEYRSLLGEGDTTEDATLKLLLVSESEFARAKEEFIASKCIDGALDLAVSIEGARKFHELELKMELRGECAKPNMHWSFFKTKEEKKQRAEWEREGEAFVHCCDAYEGQHLPALSLALFRSAEEPSLERTRLMCRAACLLRLSLVKIADEVFKRCEELLLRDKKTFEEVKKGFMECSDAGVCARSWRREIVGKAQSSREERVELNIQDVAGSSGDYLPATANYV